VAGTLEPKWNQTFIYAPMKRNEIKAQSLQMTVYDYDRIGSGEYVGEVRMLTILILIEFLRGLTVIVYDKSSQVKSRIFESRLQPLFPPSYCIT